MDPERGHPAFEELGISLQFRRLDPGFQMVLPHHRLSLYADEDPFGREIRREFPGQAEGILLFFRRMKELHRRMGDFLKRELTHPPQDLQARWEQRRSIPFSLSDIMKEGKPSLLPQLKTLKGDGEAHQLIDGLLQGLGGVKGRDCSLLYASTLFALLQEHIYYPLGGGRGVYEALLAAYQKNGGEMRRISGGLRLIDDGKKIRGLSNAEGEAFLSDTILGGPALWEIHRAGGSPEEAARKGKRLPWRRNLVLFLGLDEEVLPEEMKENVLLIPDPARSCRHPNPIWILLSPRGDETRAPQGKRALSAILPLSADHLAEEEDGEATASELMRELEEFLPFLSRGLQLQRVHLSQSLSMLRPARRWGFKIGIAPLKQMGYPGLRRFSLHHHVFLMGDLPAYGVGLRAGIDGGYYWANLLAPCQEG
jgi:phytoene dehydrogenase-like protein